MSQFRVEIDYRASEGELYSLSVYSRGHYLCAARCSLLYSWNGDSCELSSDGGAMPQDYIEGGFVQLFVVVTYALSLGNAKLK